jgi:hypothetical protein
MFDVLLSHLSWPASLLLKLPALVMDGTKQPLYTAENGMFLLQNASV